MPRRSPPTPLRLHVGPLPGRGKSKLTMPSLPRPVFYGPQPVLKTAAGPVPRARMMHSELPALVIPDPVSAASTNTNTSGAFSATPAALTGLAVPDAWSGPSSPTSAASTASTASRKKSREFVRGPWDHSGAIHVPIDLGAVLPPPMPVAINVGGEPKGNGGRKPWGG